MASAARANNSQTVHTPAEFRLDTDRVLISRSGEGDLVLHAVPVQRGAALMEALQTLAEADDGFVEALQADRNEALPM